MRTFGNDGLVFDVTDAGPSDGEVVVLLHGFPQTRASWDGVLPRLADAGYRVLVPDQRGYSPEARPDGRRAYRLDVLARDVVALVDAAGVSHAHVVGHDWGGAVAWALAGWHADRVASVTSVATPHPTAMARSMVTSLQAFRSWYMVLFQVPWLAERVVCGPLFRRALLQSGLPTEHADRYLAALRAPGAATAALSWYRAVPLVRPTAVPPSSVPTLYLYGAGDVALGRAAADLTRRYVTGPYVFEVLDDASHWLPEVHPDVVADHVLAHVRSVQPAARSALSP